MTNLLTQMNDQMPWEEILRISAITIISVISLHFFKVRRTTSKAWWVIIFSFSIICYLLVDSDRLHGSILQGLLISGAFSISFFFWMLSKSIFDDDFKFSSIYLLPLAIQLVLHYYLFYNHFGSPLKINFPPQLFDMVFLGLGLWEAYRTKGIDLIDQRIKFRNIFIIAAAILIGATLVVEIAVPNGEPNAILPILQKGSIVMLSLFVVYHELELRSNFFLRGNITPDELPNARDIDAAFIIEKIEKLITEQQVYRQEGLTIGVLAEMINAQEYKVRRSINGSMGYRNFNDFLNHHRIAEAKEILKDISKRKLTISEIAYQLGYNSIGPFNKAFKAATGTTPSFYRKERE